MAKPWSGGGGVGGGSQESLMVDGRAVSPSLSLFQIVFPIFQLHLRFVHHAICPLAAFLTWLGPEDILPRVVL